MSNTFSHCPDQQKAKDTAVIERYTRISFPDISFCDVNALSTGTLICIHLSLSYIYVYDNPSLVVSGKLGHSQQTFPESHTVYNLFTEC